MEWWQKLFAVWLLGNLGLGLMLVVAVYVPERWPTWRRAHSPPRH